MPKADVSVSVVPAELLQEMEARLNARIDEVQAGLLKDIGVVHESIKDYKRANNSTIDELRGAVESLARRSRREK